MPSYRNTPAHALRSSHNGGDSIFDDALEVLASKVASAKPKKAAAPGLFPLSKEAKEVVARMNLQRVAGNMYMCESKFDLWAVTAKGGIQRLAESTSIDNGETLQAANASNPEDMLNTILADLTL